MGRVARLPCVVCKETLGLETFGVQVHHIRDGQGMGERASNWLTVPLCQYHHTGSGGVHGLCVRGFYTRYKLDELDLLSMVNALTEGILVCGADRRVTYAKPSAARLLGLPVEA